MGTESVEEEFHRYLNLTDEFKVKNEKVSRYVSKY